MGYSYARASGHILPMVATAPAQMRPLVNFSQLFTHPKPITFASIVGNAQGYQAN